MPKKKWKDTPNEQSARFKAEAQKLVDAGELSPIEADTALDRIVRKSSNASRS